MSTSLRRGVLACSVLVILCALTPGLGLAQQAPDALPGAGVPDAMNPVMLRQRLYGQIQAFKELEKAMGRARETHDAELDLWRGEVEGVLAQRKGQVEILTKERDLCKQELDAAKKGSQGGQ